MPIYLHIVHPQDNAGFPDVSTAGRSERMRQAWGTIRERLGLRPSTSPPDDGIGSHRNQDSHYSDSTSSMRQLTEWN